MKYLQREPQHFTLSGKRVATFTEFHREGLATIRVVEWVKGADVEEFVKALEGMLLWTRVECAVAASPERPLALPITQFDGSPGDIISEAVIEPDGILILTQQHPVLSRVLGVSVIASMRKEGQSLLFRALTSADAPASKIVKPSQSI
jgi:hypothetical protein